MHRLVQFGCSIGLKRERVSVIGIRLCGPISRSCAVKTARWLISSRVVWLTEISFCG